MFTIPCVERDIILWINIIKEKLINSCLIIRIVQAKQNSKTLFYLSSDYARLL